ncbi:MFS transporter [Bacillus sp. CLL-7-23]|uniref:MFS transporter n=1 Tax=Bacillus changyiensis TaxID=3004103 RepID=A0ABT4X5D9_9BACI|nr:MFS transporter [Bacillus changyiensis]MDA7027512.1 MFS transporter [Bacillus changyiensis]
MRKLNRALTVWNKNFTLLFFSRLIKVSADSFAFYSILWFLIFSGKGAIGTALLIAVTFLPEALIAPVTGPLMKRSTLKFWMYFSDLTRALIVLSIPISYFNGFSPMWFIIGLMIIHSATGATYNPASITLIPQIVHDDFMQKANAIIQSSSEIVKLGIVTLCGGLLTLIGPAPIMIISFILYIISGILVLCIKYQADHPSTEHDNANQRGTYTGKLKRGFSLVRHHRILFPLAIYCIFMNLAAAPWEALSAIYVSEDLNGTPFTHSLLRATTAIGAFTLGFILAKVKINRYGLLFITAGMIEGASYVITGLFTILPLVFLAAFAFGAAVSAINVPEYTIIQKSVDGDDQPQVFAVINMIGNLALPLGSVICGYAAEAIGSGKVIAIGGLIQLIAGVGILLFTQLAKAQESDLIKEKNASANL